MVVLQSKSVDHFLNDSLEVAMDWQNLVIDGYGRISEILERALKDLTPDDLVWQPRPESNSIGWLTWHLTRIQDDHIASLMGEEQLWVKEGWHVKFNYPADSNDMGHGHSAEQIAALKSDSGTLLGYHKAVLERSKNYFKTLTEADLDRVLNEPRFQPLPTLGVRIISVLSDNLQHAGQVGYLRGLKQGLGWQKF